MPEIETFDDAVAAIDAIARRLTPSQCVRAGIKPRPGRQRRSTPELLPAPTPEELLADGWRKTGIGSQQHWVPPVRVDLEELEKLRRKVAFLTHGQAR